MTIIRNRRGGYYKAKALIKKWEGCHLKAYQDPIGLWTVGYGHLIGDGKKKPRRMNLTQNEVDALFDDDFNKHLLLTKKCVIKTAQRRGNNAPSLTANEWGALASLVFNVGAGRFSRSTICRLIADNDIDGAAEEFWKWRRAGGKILRGLVLRREDEKNLFLS